MNGLQFKKLEDHKTAYAYLNNQLVYVEDVARGVRCGCVCVKCAGKLIAKKGFIRIHHFAHVADTNCFGAAETALHLLSKELISHLPSIQLPQYKLEKEKRLKSGSTIKHEGVIVSGGEAFITKAVIEQAEDRFVPDITLESHSKTLFIEIAVTHKVDKAKLRHIRRAGKPAIEIHLDIKDATLTREELSNKLQNEIHLKRWLFHPKQKKTEREYYKKIRSAMRQSRKPAIKPRRNPPHLPEYEAVPDYSIGTQYTSNARLDRLYYEFFRKFGRQPSGEEESNIERIMYNAQTEKGSAELSYASVKGKRDD